MQHYTGVSELTKEQYSIVIDPQRDQNLTPEARKTLKAANYLLPHEDTAQEGFARAAIAYASNQDHAQRLYDYVSKCWFMFATPVLGSAGNTKGSPISCYLSSVADSRQSIADSWTETMWLSTEGGGVGQDWSAIRSVGTATSRGTYTPGVIPFLKAVDSITLASIQGGHRRGATAIYMDVSHPEIEEFIVSRNPQGGDQGRKLMNIHIAVNIPDSFMHAVMSDGSWELIDPHTKEVKNTVSARALWLKILETRMQRGEPYIHFTDTSNKFLPQPLKDKGLKINGSNLCVSGETLLLTHNGYQPIGTLEGLNLDVWNGNEWSNVTIAKTGVSKSLMRVTLKDGTEIECTPEHVFLKGDNGDRIAAKDLAVGDVLSVPKSLPTIATNKQWEMGMDPYSYGFYCGDGTEHSLEAVEKGNTQRSVLCAPKQACFPYLCGEIVENDPSTYTWWHPAVPKYEVPMYAHPKDKLNFLAGLLDADGCVENGDRGEGNLALKSVNKDFIHKVKLLLQTLGVDASLTMIRPAGVTQIKGDIVNARDLWRLRIPTQSVKTLAALGLVTRRLDLSRTSILVRKPRIKPPVVAKIEYGVRIADTYCAHEPKNNTLMFNGVLTGNCNEIFLPTSEDRTAVCCLSSVNLEFFDDWSKDPMFIGDLVEMLDNVLDVFLIKAPDVLHKAKNSARSERSIGLGAMGFHLYLQRKGIPFEGVMASSANRRMFEHIKKEAVARSKLLAETKGEAPDMAGTDMRNAHLLAIAPNASSSDLCGSSPGIEPYQANIVVRKTGSGSFVVKNKALDALLFSKYNLSTDERERVWDQILRDDGSVQNLEFLDQNDKDVYKTAFELDQNWIIEHASVRQQFICQGQSVNIFLRPGASASIVHKLHKDAWQKGLKGLYYLRSRNEGKAFDSKKHVDNTPSLMVDNSVTLDTGDAGCLSCEG